MFACRLCCNCIFIYAIQYIVFLVLSLKLWSVAVQPSFRISIVLYFLYRKWHMHGARHRVLGSPFPILAGSGEIFFLFCFLNLWPRKRFVDRRGYWMIYRGPGFLALVWFGNSPTPSPPSLVSKIDRRHRKTEKERNLAVDWGGGGATHTTSRNPGPL